FQAEDGIRDRNVTGVQTCALPISGYDEAVAHFGERFREFRQGNLGGSGGYSRIMFGALENTESPFILYMDDDIAIEPDSILRARSEERRVGKDGRWLWAAEAAHHG